MTRETLGFEKPQSARGKRRGRARSESCPGRQRQEQREDPAAQATVDRAGWLHRARSITGSTGGGKGRADSPCPLSSTAAAQSPPAERGYVLAPGSRLGTAACSRETRTN